VEEGEGGLTPDATTNIAPCRPTVSCTADFAAPGTFEVEVGYLYARTYHYATTRSFPFLLKLTLSKLLQLQVTSNGITVAPPPSSLYFDNMLAGLKVHVVDQHQVSPSVAVTALVGFPTNQTPSQNEGVQALVTAHVSKDVGRFHADLNGGLNEVGIDSKPVTQGFVAFALSATVPSSPFGFALETYYLSDATGPIVSVPRDGGLRMVVTLSPRPWLTFDAGGDIGYFPSVRAFSVFFGMSIAPVVFWR
jgi:hypothetical protein